MNPTSSSSPPFFFNALKHELVENIWFIGMLTHGQSEFMISYIDPESHTLRSYFPDFREGG